MITILIVDDSAFMRSLIKKAVAGLDVTVVGEAEDGKIAVEKYIELMPDVVTLDLAMLEYDGIEALKKIMQHNPEAKVIVISSTTDQESVVAEVMDLGAYTIINKPHIKDDLINAINEIASDNI